MKSLVFAAFTLSLILVVSAQCNVSDVTTCAQNYANMISGAGNDRAELERLTREFCRSTCVTTTIPACTSLNPTVQASVDQIMQACSALSNLNGGPPSGGYFLGYSVFALLSSVILAGVAAVFY